MTEIDTFVRPFYMRLLHGNFLREEPAELARFLGPLKDTAAKIDDQTLTRLLNCGGWRERLCAAWFIGLLGLQHFEARLSDLLLKSEQCFAGEGYCFALARFKSESAASTLENYLARYLPVGERHYDQDWALGALHFIDPLRALKIPQTEELWQPLRPQQGIADVRMVMQRVAEDWDSKDPL